MQKSHTLTYFIKMQHRGTICQQCSPYDLIIEVKVLGINFLMDSLYSCEERVVQLAGTYFTWYTYSHAPHNNPGCPYYYHMLSSVADGDPMLQLNFSSNWATVILCIKANRFLKLKLKLIFQHCLSLLEIKINEKISLCFNSHVIVTSLSFPETPVIVMSHFLKKRESYFAALKKYANFGWSSIQNELS